MPRVNRDLQRRLAARRERERRRPPAERRYTFAPGEPPREAEEELPTAAPNGETRPRADTVGAAPPPAAARAGRTPPKAAPRPFSAYRSEYRYVLNDLRRVAAVIGSLLLILIILYFVIPR